MDAPEREEFYIRKLETCYVNSADRCAKTSHEKLTECLTEQVHVDNECSCSCVIKNVLRAECFCTVMQGGAKVGRSIPTGVKYAKNRRLMALQTLCTLEQRRH